jgi:hypothetical protein
MSAQDYAREQASRLAETDPSAAFDLVLAADDLDKSAAQRPEISALGRRMRGIMAEAVKHMARAVPDLVWECGGAYDYIGLGKKFTLQGMTAPKEWNSGVRIRVEIVANAAHQGPGYNVRVYSEGKGEPRSRPSRSTWRARWTRRRRGSSNTSTMPSRR